MSDLDREIREAQSFRPPGGWGAVSKKNFFSALQAPFWSKNKGEGGGGKRAPWAPSLDPLLEGMHH